MSEDEMTIEEWLACIDEFATLAVESVLGAVASENIDKSWAIQTFIKAINERVRAEGFDV